MFSLKVARHPGNPSLVLTPLFRIWQVARQIDVIETRLKEEQKTSLTALESLLQQVKGWWMGDFLERKWTGAKTGQIPHQMDGFDAINSACLRHLYIHHQSHKR